MAAMRAIDAVRLANFLADSRKISLDMVIKTMYNTGRDMGKNYRETSEGGLAVTYTDLMEHEETEAETASTGTPV